jgi:alpha-methylacyl-CoA racemase
MQPLAGLTVADLTRYLPGPFASRELQRLGARVVKIEPPDGDPTRQTSPGVYQALNAGKEIVAWDARSEPPPAMLLEADIVLEGFRPGVWERLGVELLERTILCSITGFGRDGPRARQAGHDLNYLGYAGALADTAPALPPVQVADLAAGAQAAVIEILAALLERGRTGRGQHIVVSMTHGSHHLVAHRLAGEPIPRLLTGGAACYRIYETADGRHLTVAALEPKFWQRLCELLGRPDLAGRAFEPELPELEALFRTRTMQEWLDLLEHEDTCVGPVLSLSEAAAELA